MWREQKQLWEACLHWPAATVTLEGASRNSPGVIVEGEATYRQLLAHKNHYIILLTLLLVFVFLLILLQKIFAFLATKVLSLVSLFVSGPFWKLCFSHCI